MSKTALVDKPVCRRLRAPFLTDDDVCHIVETTAQRTIKLLERRGVLDGAVLDRLADEEPVLAGVTAASVRGMVATVERAGGLGQSQG